MRKITMEIGKIKIEASLFDTPTADAIYNSLPIMSKAETWGEEVYFETPIEAALENSAKDIVELGELAYFPDEKVIAIGFGRTPVSEGDEIRLADKCNIWGKALNDVRQLKAVKEGDNVSINKIKAQGVIACYRMP
ncbi:MAG: hypothetical protein IBX72_16070 [Nitrospirae bacterium]|nr:hypothetical protein [Nitrospirota bacterium]